MFSLLKALKKYFGYDEFRPGQREIIESILANKNVLAVLPTGAGKSLCYQLPALVSENFSIVVSPLIALMKDQVDNINLQAEFAAFINSTMNFRETEKVLQQIKNGRIKLLYLAPEKLETAKFSERIKDLKPNYLFVDEAHCISEWGHNFRPSYTKIKDFIRFTSIKKVSAFTATATPEVVKDIVEQLNLKKPEIFVRGFERENLHLQAYQTKNKKQKCFDLIKYFGTPAIVYTSSRKLTEEIAEYLNMKGIRSSYYHAGLHAIERKKIQESFINNEIRAIAATNAFGMGIDKADIRLVIHYNTPGSIENYYQEIGRAGRNGKDAFAILLHDKRDINIQNYFISNSYPRKEDIQTIYKAICDYNRAAEGTLPEKELVIDKEYISNYLKKEISTGILHASLKQLENAGYIRRISEFEKSDSLHFLVNRNELKTFLKKQSNEELVNTVMLLLREYGSSLFSGSVNISAANLSSKYSTPNYIIENTLTTLNNLNIISFEKALTNETVLLTVPRVKAELLSLNYKTLNESYLYAQSKLEKMIDFVYTRQCRMKFILNYFGEKLDDYRCGKCDNCTSGKQISDSTIEYISELMLQTLNEAKEPITESALFDILKGKKTKNSYAFFDNFAACRNYSSSELKIVLQTISSNGLAARSSINKKYIEITTAGKELIEPAELITEETGSSLINNYDDDLYLFNLLREARKKASKRFLQTGYLICPDDILKEVVYKKPKTKAEMLNISGFNNRMFNKLGEDFLEVINHFLTKGKKEETGTKSVSLPQNITGTYALLKKKYSLSEIASTLKLSEAVVSMQIESILEYLPNTDVDYLFDENVFEKIKSEAEKGYNNLKELKERLPAGISYAQIRITAAKLKAIAHL